MSLNDDLVLQLIQQINGVTRDVGELKEMDVQRKESVNEIKSELHIVKLDVAAIKDWISKNKSWLAGVAFAMGVVGSCGMVLAKWLFGIYFAK